METSERYLHRRSAVCNTLLVVLSVLALPALAASVYRAAEFGWQLIWGVQVAVASVLWCVTLFRHRLPFSVRAGTLCLLAFVLGITGLLTFGRLTGSEVWFAVLPALASVLFGFRAGILALVVVVLSVSAVAALIVIEHRLPDVDMVAYATSATAWIALVFGIAVAGGSAAAVVGLLNKSLFDSLKSADERADALNRQALERGRVEVALRESEARFRALVEYAPEAITMIDVDSGLYIAANPMAEALHGLSREQLVGKCGPSDLSPEFQPDGRVSRLAVSEYLMRAQAGELPRFEWMHLTPDGKQTLCEVSLAPLPDPERKLVRASIVDITERKAAEALRFELEASLAQAQKMEAVGQLTAGVAHDFNNLLAVIMGNAELLRDHPVADRRGLDEVLQAARRGADLTHRLLAFSRKQVLDPEIVDANDVIADVARLLERTLEEHVDIQIRTNADLWRCEVDPAQLQNALVNLAINARHAMPDGGSLTFETENARLDDEHAAADLEVEPGHYVAISVRDTGTGMSPQVCERAVEPFFTTKEVGHGSGLGLSMVYGFVKQSDGNLKIDSTQGEGTTVTLFLPSASRTEPARTQSAPDEVPVARGETVLLVEDDADVRDMTAALLSSLGYRVEEAADGAAALESLETTQSSLLVTDVVLPGGLNGRELGARAQRHASGIKVLYMSGYPEDALTDRGRLSAGVAFLQKPFGRDGLARAVRKALDGPAEQAVTGGSV